MRLYNEQIQYPCDNQLEEQEKETTTSVLNFAHTQNEEEIDQEEGAEDEVYDDESYESHNNNEESERSNDPQLMITPHALEILNAHEYDSNFYTSFTDYDECNDKDVGLDPTEAQVRLATDLEFNKTLERIISEADKLSESEHIIEPNEDTDLPVDEIPNTSRHKTVLGDIFHFMDRSKLPIHHEYKALFFRSL